MLSLNKKKQNLNFLHIYKKYSFVFNLKRNLKLETFDHGTFLYKVHELLLITLQLWPLKEMGALTLIVLLPVRRLIAVVQLKKSWE